MVWMARRKGESDLEDWYSGHSTNVFRCVYGGGAFVSIHDANSLVVLQDQ